MKNETKNGISNLMYQRYASDNYLWECMARFQRFILSCILTNTFSMGIEFHNQPEILTKTVEISNLVFSIIFAVEMLLKLIAYGFFRYISDGFNVFDGLIVMLRYKSSRTLGLLNSFSALYYLLF